ncbi:hypothetical protein GGR98_002260 [Parageobacillus caldoxylosilyticus]|nr:hypothetical protein [Parageobacillus caldoxylosilyticus]
MTTTESKTNYDCVFERGVVATASLICNTKTPNFL